MKRVLLLLLGYLEEPSTRSEVCAGKAEQSPSDTLCHGADCSSRLGRMHGLVFIGTVLDHFEDHPSVDSATLTANMS